MREDAFARPRRSLMHTSLTLGQIAGVTVRVYWIAPALVIAFALALAGTVGPTPQALLLFGGISAALAAGVLLHEFAHVFAARCCGQRADEILLHPLGGFAVLGADVRTVRSELLIALAGPFANLVLLLAGLAAYGMAGGPPDPQLAWPFLDTPWSSALSGAEEDALARAPMLQLLRLWCGVQACLMWFNLALVAYPMDGGRVLCGLLWMRLGNPARARLTGLVAARVIGAIVTGVGLWFRHPLAIGMGALNWGLAHRMLGGEPLAHAAPVGQRSEGEMGDELDALDLDDPAPAPADLATARSQPRPSIPHPPRRRPRPGPLRKLRLVLIRWRARRWLRREERLIDTHQRVDRLLDKISRHGGVDCLSAEERKFLRRASKKFRRKLVRSDSD